MKPLFNFDYDGVIADSIQRLIRLVTEVQKQTGEGRPPTLEDFQRIPNLTAADMGRRLGISEERLKRFVDISFEIQTTDDDYPLFFPGMTEILRKLSARGPIVIVTSSVADEIWDTLKLNGVDNTVCEILDGRDPRDKAGRIAHAVEKYGADINHSYMVGDSASDIRHGRTAGVKTIAVTWGYQLRELLIAENPHYVADAPANLLELVDQLEPA